MRHTGRAIASLAILSAMLAVPLSVLAEVVISEIMYDLSGSDTDREWIEVWNDTSGAVDISGWKFFENNTNHGLTLSQGSATIPAGGYAVIVAVPAGFLADWPSFSGTVFDSSFSLSNTGETLALKNGDTLVSEVTYSSATGAAGDGNSLALVGGSWQAASPTPGEANGSTSESSPSADSSGASDSSDAPAGRSVPVEPQIFADASGPATVAVGADALFSGKAFGLERFPLPNARFLWNFGDGATFEGKEVSHVYAYPGRYVVVLDVSSGEYAASDRVTVTAVAAPVGVSAAVAGPGGSITVENSSAHDLDLSFWRLSDGRSVFALPRNTVIAGKSSLTFGAAVTGLNAAPGSAFLEYPNGVLASSLAKPPAPRVAAKAPAAPAPAAQSAKTPPPAAAPASSPAQESVVSNATTAFASVAEAFPPRDEPAVNRAASNVPSAPGVIEVSVKRWDGKELAIYGGILLAVIGIGVGLSFYLNRSAPRSDEPHEEKIEIRLLE